MLLIGGDEKAWYRHSGEMSAYAPLLEPFERSGLQFFFCKHNLKRVFSPRHRETLSIFSRGLPTEEAMIKSAKAMTAATNSVATLQLLNFSP